MTDSVERSIEQVTNNTHFSFNEDYTMNKWITDRRPKAKDADENGNVWTTGLEGSVHRTPYGWVNLGVPWMAKQKIVPPEPYVWSYPRWKPKPNDTFWHVSKNGEVNKFFSNLEYEKEYNFGNCFQTKEQAEEAAHRMRETLLNYHKELNNV